MTRFVAVDFFCGAGGMTCGLIRAGMHVLAGVDNEPQCEATFRQNKNRNGPRPEFVCKDIFPKSRAYTHGQQEEIGERIEELIREYKARTGYKALRLIFAICAPCQPFTKITKIKMSDGRKFKRTNDANLLLTMTNLIERFRPDALICENVEGIADGKNSMLVRFKRKLKRAGYDFDARVINAARFGVPQNRKRTIGIGFDSNRYAIKCEVPDADPRVRKSVTTSEVIGQLPPLAAGDRHPTIPNHRARSLSEINLKRISCAPPGETNGYLRYTPYGDLSLPCHRRLEEREGSASFTDTYTRMKGDEVAPTITTKLISITNGRFGHFDIRQNRALTPYEGALLQTFPKWYIFHPADNTEFTSTLIGNAVPPTLAKFFGKYVIDNLPA